MPIPLLLWGAAALLAGTGIVKGVSAKNDFDEAKSIGERAQNRYNSASNQVDQSRKSTQRDLEQLGKLKVNVFSNQIQHLVSVLKKGKSKLTGFDTVITTEQLYEYEKLVLNSLAIEQGLGSGAVGGALAAMGAYGTVGTLATASTGAAISGLTGVAATNATLAWLGGGSLAAGGFGMAGGMIALGGIVAGPALAIGGFIMASKAEEALTKAHQYDAKVDTAIAEMRILETALKAIRTNVAEMSSVITALAKRYDTVKVDSVANNVAFSRMLQIGKAVKAALDIPVIEKDGKAVAGIRSKYAGLLEIAS